MVGGMNFFGVFVIVIREIISCLVLVAAFWYLAGLVPALQRISAVPVNCPISYVVEMFN